MVDRRTRFEFASRPGAVGLVGVLATVALWLLLRGDRAFLYGADVHVLLTGAVVVATMTITLRIQMRLVGFDLAHVRAIERRAAHDELTGLPRRPELVRRLEAVLSDAYRQDSVVGVLFLDLDGFKVVNDSMGHEAGDELLQQFALRLSSSVRAGDLVARVGGDEFVVVTVGQKGSPGVRTVAEHLQRIFETPTVLNNGEVLLTPSIGVAMASRSHPALADELLHHADQAMYRAKRAGSRIVVLDEDQRRENMDRREVQRALVPALASGQFEVYYQSIVSASERTTVGFEGLIRWRHPVQGLIEPARFLVVAEEAGLLARLGEVVLREVTAQISLWNHLTPGDRKLSTALNLAERQLIDSSFPDHVAEVVNWARISPSQLDLEIGEELLLRRIQDTSGVIKRLSAMGCRIVVDDIGAINGSVSRIREIAEIGEIKIARTVTATLRHDPLARAVVESSVAFAGSAGLQVVAQGVETEQQRLDLMEFGIDHMQGFLFQKPSPSELVDLGGTLSTSSG